MSFDRLDYILGTSPSTLDPLSNKLTLRRLEPVRRFRVSSTEEGRPDLISYRYYGSVELWWVVLEYNGILHHLDLVADLEISLPSQVAILDLIQRANSRSDLSAVSQPTSRVIVI